MWLIMALLLGYFAYFKGWIFSDLKNISPDEFYTIALNGTVQRGET